MKKRILGFLRTNRQGLALISVLGVVTLATILILALFSVSDAEFKAARNYADGTTARQLADTAVNMVISQIQAGATGVGVAGTSTSGANRTTWASQPGAIRVYRTSGEFAQGRRLYSSDEMVVIGTGPGGESKMAKDAPDPKWDSEGNKAVWVDLNQPVVRALTSGKTGTRTIFPVVDPKAAATVNGFQGIEGFSYSSQMGAGLPDIDGVVSTGQPEDLRLPMPVRWLYVLKDGTMGTVTATGGGVAQWDGKTGEGTPSESNPIIGRVAFWTDDESCRLNINTAGEPGNFATPSIFHARDSNWSNNQPVWREYQRYPGHPATVALSSVLAPNPKHDPSRYDNDSFSGRFPPAFVNPSYRNLKDTICTLVPKLIRGGSADGTRAYVADDFNSNTSPDVDQLRRDFEAASKEHLFLSVDEWIFANQPSSGSERSLVNSKSDLGELLTPETLERSRFFLSANSRAPELNMFGLPRVAIWPVPDASLGPKFRTGFDSTIAYVSSLASQKVDTNNISLNSYYFSRRDSESAIEDIGSGLQTPGLIRNKNLMFYLDQLISVPQMPGGGTFTGKYGRNDARQILVEIFDYIRTTNLYDAFLDKLYTDERPDKQHELWDDGNTAGAIKYTKQQDLWYQRPKQGTYYTYTAPRFDTIRRVGDLGGIVPTEFQKNYEPKRMTTGAYPGHGQVRPIEWTTGGQTYKGFGRFPTISEVSLHFICTADGNIGRTNNTEVPKWPGIFKVRDQNDPTGYRYSGGRTAKHIDPVPFSTDKVSRRIAYAIGRDGNGNLIPEWWHSNLPPFPSKKTFEDLWGCDFAQYGLGGEKDPLRHPGSKAMNWNGTLERDTPLLETQKQVQVMFQIELFVPSLGYTKYTPDFSIVLAGDTIGGFEVDAENKTGGPIKKALFETTRDQTIQSTIHYMGSALGESVNSVNVTPLGGSYGTSPLMSGRQVKSPAPMPNDPGYVTAGTDDPNRSMLNFPLVSNPFTVNRNKDIVFRAPKTPIEFDIYAAHDRKGKNATPSQKVFVKFEDGKVPTPYLVVYSSEHVQYIDSNGNQFDRPAVHAPHWWAFNSGGAIQRWEGRVGPGGNLGSIKEHTFNTKDDHETRGRFFSNGFSLGKTWDPHFSNGPVDIPSSVAIYGYSPLSTYSAVRSNPVRDWSNRENYQDGDVVEGKPGMGNCLFYGTDSVRSMVPDHGDYRVLAARPVVDGTAWVKHRVWQERPEALFAHSLMGAASDREAGVDVGDTATNPLVPVETNRMVSAWYQADKVPDTPLTQQASLYSQQTGDFDTGVGDIRDGAYINKADDGNVSVDQEWYGTLKQFYKTRNSYFKSSFLQFPSPGAFFTPNRQITSPVVFGSLPTGVYGSHGANAKQLANGVPWRTLLFRPDNTGTHYGNGVVSPADHNILDLFWMPVVEPYAISDSYSTAGKINMNYQMVPFPHVKRATGMHAVLKNELVTAFSKFDAFNATTNKKLVPSQSNTVVYKRYKNPNSAPPGVWGLDGDPMEWHRRIAIDETLKQFDERFTFKPMPAGTFQGLFRTASQICEINMIPRPSTLRAIAPNPEPQPQNFANESQRRTGMANFWAYNNLTGENLRERTYSNIYQKVTTRSNTFRVYFISQAIKKAKSVKADEVDLAKDTVTGEYRGTALIDRFLDFSSVERSGSTVKAFPDYADGSPVFGSNAKPSLETLYHYRVLEMKQFLP